MFPIWAIILIFVASLAILAKSSAILVRSVTGLARLFRLSEYAIALLVMSFATSVSELFVGISSAFEQIPTLSLGNILGANLLNISLVIGLPALIAGNLKVESKIERRNFWFIFFLSLFPFFLGIDGVISRGDGIILLLGFISYVWLIMGEQEYFTKVYNSFDFVGVVRKTASNLFLFALGVILLLLSSGFMVWSAKQVLGAFSLEHLFFGIIFVALGTTMPELAFGIRAALSEHGSMTVGNALGSIAFNAAFILGIVSIITPIEISAFSELFNVIVAFVAIFIMFNIFLYRGENISRREGIFLILAYVAYLIFEFI